LSIIEWAWPNAHERKREKIRRWRESAEECRAAATGTKTSEGRPNLLDLARAYDDMADRAERSLKNPREFRKPLTAQHRSTQLGEGHLKGGSLMLDLPGTSESPTGHGRVPSTWPPGQK